MIETVSVSFVAAFIGGVVITFFPCTYPMLIGYLALLISGERQTSISRSLCATFWFFIGFAITYALFGGIAGLFGQFSQVTVFFNTLKPLFTTVGSILFLIIGLVLLRVVPLPEKLKQSRAASLPTAVSPNTRWGALTIGAIFAVGWSPCVGPLLGGILLLAATSGSVITGMALLVVFSLGMMVPLAALTILYAKSSRLLQVIERKTPVMQMVGGFLFIVIGLLFLVGGLSFFPYPSFLEGLEQYI